MKPSLVYIATGKEVKIGDEVTLSHGEKRTVAYFTFPHKPSSEGKVSVRDPQNPDFDHEYYVSVIGAIWIDRTDRN